MLRLATAALLITLLSGCVSAAIDQGTGKYKGVFYEPAPRDEIRSALGEPVETYQRSSTNKQAPFYSISEFDSYDVYQVKGKIYKPGAGNTQAANSAASLGLTEFYFIPATLVKLAVEPFKKRTLVVFYNKDKEYIAHQLFDADGQRESIAE